MHGCVYSVTSNICPSHLSIPDVHNSEPQRLRISFTTSVARRSARFAQTQSPVHFSLRPHLKHKALVKIRTGVNTDERPSPWVGGVVFSGASVKCVKSVALSRPNWSRPCPGR